MNTRKYLIISAFVFSITIVFLSILFLQVGGADASHVPSGCQDHSASCIVDAQANGSKCSSETVSCGQLCGPVGCCDDTKWEYDVFDQVNTGHCEPAPFPPDSCQFVSSCAVGVLTYVGSCACGEPEPPPPPPPGPPPPAPGTFAIVPDFLQVAIGEFAYYKAWYGATDVTNLAAWTVDNSVCVEENSDTTNCDSGATYSDDYISSVGSGGFLAKVVVPTGGGFRNYPSLKAAYNPGAGSVSDTAELNVVGRSCNISGLYGGTNQFLGCAYKDCTGSQVNDKYYLGISGVGCTPNESPDYREDWAAMLPGPVLAEPVPDSVSALPYHDWHNASIYPPTTNDPGLLDNVLAKYVGRFYFKAGTYRFYVGADDKARLYIDKCSVFGGVTNCSGGSNWGNAWGPPTVDKWVVSPTLGAPCPNSACFFADVTFATAGYHTLRYEFREITGGAKADLRWEYTPPNGTIAGRVVKDDNANQVVDAGEQYIADPSAPGCSNASVQSGFTLSFSGGAGTALVNLCNPTPYYLKSLPPGTYTVTMNVPGGWEVVSANPISVPVVGGVQSDRWFYVRQIPAIPNPNVSVSITAVNGSVPVSLSRIKDGDLLDFTVTFRNRPGAGTATGIAGNISLSPNLISPSGFTCVICNGGTLSDATFSSYAWGGSLAAGVGSVQMRFSATVDLLTNQNFELLNVRANGTYSPSAVPYDVNYTLLASPIRNRDPEIIEVAP